MQRLLKFLSKFGCLIFLMLWLLLNFAQANAQKGPSPVEPHNPWIGIWEHAFLNKEKRIEGVMILEKIYGNQLSGTYNYLLEQHTVLGTLQGKLESGGKIFRGRWEENTGQHGNFIFHMQSDLRSFVGEYDLQDPPTPAEHPVWNGVKLD